MGRVLLHYSFLTKISVNYFQVLIKQWQQRLHILLGVDKFEDACDEDPRKMADVGARLPMVM